MKRRVVWAAALFLGASLTLSEPSAWAGAVALVPVTAGDVTVSLPRGWATETDPKTGTFVALREPTREDSPSVFVFVRTSGVTATVDQMLDRLIAKVPHAQVLSRSRLPSGETKIVAAFTAKGVAGRAVAIGAARSGGAFVGMLLARADQIDALGGSSLVAAMLGSVKVSGR